LEVTSKKGAARQGLLETAKSLQKELVKSEKQCCSSEGLTSLKCHGIASQWKIFYIITLVRTSNTAQT
jgi:hypothetical protein